MKQNRTKRMNAVTAALLILILVGGMADAGAGRDLGDNGGDPDRDRTDPLDTKPHPRPVAYGQFDAARIGQSALCRLLHFEWLRGSAAAFSLASCGILEPETVEDRQDGAAVRLRPNEM